LNEFMYISSVEVEPIRLEEIPLKPNRFSAQSK
jgi:hypothetical protein